MRIVFAITAPWVLLAGAALGASAGSSNGTPFAAPGVVWRDAAGNRAPAVSSGPFGPLEYFDPQGFVWSLDVATGTIGPFGGLSALFFESGDCSGPAFLFIDPQPLFVFPVATATSGLNSFFAYPTRTVQTVAVTINSGIFGGGSCQPVVSGGASPAVPLSGLTGPLTPPATSFVPPFHPELVH